MSPKQSDRAVERVKTRFEKALGMSRLQNKLIIVENKQNKIALAKW
jgi:hypothetical protein